MKEVNTGRGKERPPPQRVPVPSDGGPSSVFGVGFLKKRSIILDSIYQSIYPSIYRRRVQQSATAPATLVTAFPSVTCRPDPSGRFNAHSTAASQLESCGHIIVFFCFFIFSLTLFSQQCASPPRRASEPSVDPSESRFVGWLGR